MTAESPNSKNSIFRPQKSPGKVLININEKRRSGSFGTVTQIDKQRKYISF